MGISSKPTIRSRNNLKLGLVGGTMLFLVLFFATIVLMGDVVAVQSTVLHVNEIGCSDNHLDQEFTGQIIDGAIDDSDRIKLSRTSLLEACLSLAPVQLLVLAILTIIDVALLIAAIAWPRYMKRTEKKKNTVSMELHENHLGG